MKKIQAIAGIAIAAMHLGAAPVVEITSVQQQYPWTNTVDITYTSTGIAEDNTYYVVFQAHDSAGKEIGVITNDLKVSQGSTWVAQWQPPFNVRYENCTMTPYVYKGWQDDYMIVDLDTWAVTYEGMSTQQASNEKYQAAIYKTAKMVFRKIEGGKTYTIGDDRITTNTKHTTYVPRDYYIAIFPCTEGQYRRIAGDSTADSNLPKNNVSNTSLRNAGVAATPSAASPLGKFNANVVNAGFGGGNFDLPTESMWEVAARAGTTTRYYWSDSNDSTLYYQNAWGKSNSPNNRQEVGTKDPNQWGLYDIIGNVWDVMRDVGRGNTNLATLADQCNNAFTPRASTSQNICLRGQGYPDSSPDAYTGSIAGSYWSSGALNWVGSHVGFRIAYIPE